MYAPDSIEGLRLANMDFSRHQEFGILPDQFAELLITSGLVLFDEVTWLCYAR
jgi:CCR4-NOT transcription complex subunit 7/8